MWLPINVTAIQNVIEIIFFPFILRKEGITSKNLLKWAKTFTKLYMILSLWIQIHKRKNILQGKLFIIYMVNERHLMSHHFSYNSDSDSVTKAKAFFPPLMLSRLGKYFSRQHFEILVLCLQENRLRHFMQIVSWGQFAWNVKAYFGGKYRQLFICLICP